MKNTILIFLLLCSTVTAVDHYHRIQISTGGVSVDSVTIFEYTGGTLVDSLKFLVSGNFPIIDSINVSDTNETTLYYRYYFTDDAGLFTTAFETLPEIVSSGGATGGAFIAGFYTVDTLTGDSIPLVFVSVQNDNGVTQDNFVTDADGFEAAHVTAGNWTFIALQPGGSFRDTTVNVTANDTILIRGSTAVVADPAGPNTATAFGDIRDLTGALIANVTVIATRPRDAQNTCDSTWTLPADVIAYTNSSGRFSMTLVKSSCFGDQAYTFTAYKSIGGILQKLKERDVAIPTDSTTIRIW